MALTKKIHHSQVFVHVLILLSQMGQLRDDLRRTTEQYRELNQALAQQQEQMTSLQVSKIQDKESLFISIVQFAVSIRLS